LFSFSTTCNRDDEAQVCLDHLLFRAVVAALDPLRELDLLGRGEQVDLADVLQEQLERVGRDLARLLRRLLFLHFGTGHDLDVKLFESVVEVVDLCRLELELIERHRDLVCRQMTVLLPGLQQRLRVVRLQKLGDTLRCYRYLGCAHSVPPSWTGVFAMPHCAS
jgi:hypothetical protein